MKKLLRYLTIIISTLLITLIFYILLINIVKFSANSNYKNGKYEKAADLYTWALVLDVFDQKNETIKYKIADCLVRLPFNYKTQTLITSFLELYEKESFSYPLREKLNKFKSDLDWRIGPNYIDKAPNNNQVLRWEDDAFPLKVYISDGSEENRAAIKRAFEYWQYATGNFVSFAYVNNEDADIIVKLDGGANANCQDENEECLYVAALTTPIIKNNILQHMELAVHTSDPAGRLYPAEQIYKVTLHEIGHTLGIMGHSDNPNDIMYARDQHNDNDVFAQHARYISRRDLNTLNFLYMIVPNISNIPEEKHNTVNKIHPNIILGTTEEIKLRDIKNAKSYIAKAPNLAIGYMDLGNAYFQAELYNKAFETYQKGFKLAANKNEQYDFVYNMSLLCLKMGDKDKALEYAEYAKTLKPTDEIIKYIHDIKTPWGLGNSRF